MGMDLFENFAEKDIKVDLMRIFKEDYGEFCLFWSVLKAFKDIFCTKLMDFKELRLKTICNGSFSNFLSCSVKMKLTSSGWKWFCSFYAKTTQ